MVCISALILRTSAAKVDYPADLDFQKSHLNTIGRYALISHFDQSQSHYLRLAMR
jgi:hypothetical protein